MLNEVELKQVMERAKRYAERRGSAELAEDFAQEAVIAIAGGRKATLAQLFIDFLRREHGNTRTGVGRERRRATATAIRLDAPVGDSEDSSHFHELIGHSEPEPRPIERDSRIERSLRGRDYEIYGLVELDGLKQSEAAERMGVTPGRISQILSPIKAQIRLEEERETLARVLEDLEENKQIAEFDLDWISL